MLSYRHAYHAGNHADVLKHGVLTLVLRALQRKVAPLCYIDTHAGAGRYDLKSPAAEKTAESRDGIARAWARDDVPEPLHDYFAAIRAENPSPALRYYPGSPRLAQHLLRPHDRMVLIERHPTDHGLLVEAFARISNTRIEHGDGYELLKAFVPPLEKRGVVLIDPSYEIKTEYKAVIALLTDAVQRWATGVYILWYPILDRAAADQILRRLVTTGIRRMLSVEFSMRPPKADGGLTGSGLVIINPPYQLDEQLKRLLPWLRRVLKADTNAPSAVRWLIPE